MHAAVYTRSFQFSPVRADFHRVPIRKTVRVDVLQRRQAAR